MNIKDYIRRNIVTVKENDLLTDALKIIVTEHILDVPAISENNKLLGFVKSTELLDLVFPDYLKNLQPQLDKLYGNDISNYLKDKQEVPFDSKVKDFITKPEYKLTENFSFVEALDIFVTKKVNSIAVVNNSDELIGLLFQQDFIKVIHEKINDLLNKK